MLCAGRCVLSEQTATNHVITHRGLSLIVERIQLAVTLNPRQTGS